jgi:hypothetical protein
VGATTSPLTPSKTIIVQPVTFGSDPI